MKRREFITLLGGAAAWPLAARAQQHPDKIRQIGMLIGFAQDDPVAQSMVAAFRGALSKLGWIEGSNVRIELRWAGPDIERINRLAKELAGLMCVLRARSSAIFFRRRHQPRRPLLAKFRPGKSGTDDRTGKSRRRH